MKIGTVVIFCGFGLKKYYHTNCCFFANVHDMCHLTLPYLWGGQALTPAQCWGCISSAQCASPKCNHKVTGSGYKAVDGCEAVNRWL